MALENTIRAAQGAPCTVEIYTHGAAEFPFSTTSYADFVDLREQTTDVFSGMVAHSMMLTYLRSATDARPLLGGVVSGNFFDLLGVRPVLGRAFLPEEGRVEGERPVTVLSRGCWQRECGGDPAAVGRTVRLNRRDYTRTSPRASISASTPTTRRTSGSI